MVPRIQTMAWATTWSAIASESDERRGATAKGGTIAASASIGWFASASCTRPAALRPTSCQGMITLERGGKTSSHSSSSLPTPNQRKLFGHAQPGFCAQRATGLAQPSVQVKTPQGFGKARSHAVKLAGSSSLASGP